MKVYDFDKTIYDGDASVDFYFFCLKNKWFLIGYSLIQFYGILLYLFKIHSKEKMKEYFFVFLKGVDDVDALVETFWNQNAMKIYPWYLKNKSKEDVIISASPYFLLAPIIKRLEIKHLLASDVDKKTGQFYSLNCYGQEKVRRYQAVFKQEITEFYSDSISDLPLALISKKAFMIKKGKVENWDIK